MNSQSVSSVCGFNNETSDFFVDVDSVKAVVKPVCKDLVKLFRHELIQPENGSSLPEIFITVGDPLVRLDIGHNFLIVCRSKLQLYGVDGIVTMVLQPLSDGTKVLEIRGSSSNAVGDPIVVVHCGLKLKEEQMCQIVARG